MAEEEKRKAARQRQELLRHLRKLLKWKNNDVVKLAFLDADQLDRVDGMDLSGVAELKRGANGVFEAKFIDRVKVLEMMRQLVEQGDGGALEGFLEQLKDGGDGDEM